MLVSATGHAKLADFGLATRVAGQRQKAVRVHSEAALRAGAKGGSKDKRGRVFARSLPIAFLKSSCVSVQRAVMIRASSDRTYVATVSSGH